MSSPSSDLQEQPIPPLYDQRHAIENEHNGVQRRRLTRRQLFYVCIPQGFGAAIIDATCNFAIGIGCVLLFSWIALHSDRIACAMYRTTRNEIRLWPLNKNTIAGDMGVTVIIQGILTTLIAGALVRGDVLAKRIEPFSFAWPDVAWWQNKSGRQNWCKSRITAVLSFLSPKQSLSFRHGGSSFAKTLIIILLRGLLISTLYFIIFWPIAIAITAPLFGGIDMRGSWTPEIIKAVFGGILGLFMNPFVAALVLGSHATHEGESISVLADSTVPPQSVRCSSAARSIGNHGEGSPPCHTRIASTTIMAKPPDIAIPKQQDGTVVA